MESHRHMEDQAAAFLAQRDGGDWTREHEERLHQWLAVSTARRVAFLRLEAVWEEAGRLKALGAGLPSGAVPPLGELRHGPFFDSNTRVPLPERVANSSKATRSRSVSGGLRTSGRGGFFALAASILLALGVGADVTSVANAERYGTPIGGIKTVPLRDGSNITLNTATQVRVELSPQERHILLDEGEAFFEVAHDPARPFIVEVGGKKVIAVGTKFSVRRQSNDVRVVVTEGKVRVETGSAGGGDAFSRVTTARGKSTVGTETTAFTRASGPGEAFLTPGNVASVGDDGIVIEQRPLTEAQDDVSWRQGYLTFHDTSLADAVAEFNRYNTHQVVIEDPAVAEIRISGSFRVRNYEAFTRVLEDGFALHARRSDDTTMLIR